MLESPGYEPARHNGFDFQDFEELTKAYDKLLVYLCEQGICAKQVQIDFTGGQKPTSVVAAVVTLFSRATNQYVMTNPEDENSSVWKYPVLGYDFREVFEPAD